MRLSLFCFLIFITTSSYSKKEKVIYKFENRVDSLVILADSMQLAGSDMNRLLANNRYQEILREVLRDPISLKYDFSRLTNLSVLEDPRSKKFRIYTWVLKLGNDSYDYFGFTQYQRKKGKNKTENYVYALTNKSQEIGKNETDKLDTNNWIGCVYYQIVPPKKRKDRTYLLMGWDGNNWRSTKKIIETITFSKNGEVTLGKPVIKINVVKNGRGKKKAKTVLEARSRLIFEFNGKVSMTLGYNPDMKMVIYDHLSPSHPRLASVPHTYAPDFTYDGLKYEKKKWIHYQDVDVRQEDLVEPVKWKPEDAKSRTKDTLIPLRPE